MSFLEVDPRSLTDTASKYSYIASAIRSMFTSVSNSIDAITSNDCWAGDSSNAYKVSFENLRAKLDGHIKELEQLGPSTQNVAANYESTEEENKVAAQRLGSDYRG